MWGSERDNPHVATLKILVTKLLVISHTDNNLALALALAGLMDESRLRTTKKLRHFTMALES